jgi:ADP-ribose pyrophosphatase
MPEIDDPRLFSPQCSSLIPVETVHENPWFAVRNRGGYFTVEYDQFQVIILPVVENHSIIMVRAKRPVLNDICLELPAGGAMEGELPVQAAARELAEETGIEIQDLRRFIMLPPISVSPNRNPNLAHIFHIHISMNEYEMRKEHDKEIESVKLFSLDEIQRMVCEGEIYISLPIAVISRYLMSSDYEEITRK